MPTKLAIPHHGDADLWAHRPLLGLCSSRRAPAGVLLPTAQWAIAQREAGMGVVSGFQTPLERAALRYLLAPVLHGGEAPPVVWVLATELWRRPYPAPVQTALAAGRLLVLAPVGAARLTAASALARTHWLLAECPGPVVVPWATPGGVLAEELARQPGRWVDLKPE